MQNKEPLSFDSLSSCSSHREDLSDQFKLTLLQNIQTLFDEQKELTKFYKDIASVTSTFYKRHKIQLSCIENTINNFQELQEKQNKNTKKNQIQEYNDCLERYCHITQTNFNLIKMEENQALSSYMREYFYNIENKKSDEEKKEYQEQDEKFWELYKQYTILHQQQI